MGGWPGGSARLSRVTILGTEIDNRPGWASAESLREYATFEGWIDAGERAAFAAVASHARNQPILDVGIGGGRTTSLLRLISDDYVGIDYTPAMVDLARTHHPDADIRLGDARDLRDFPDDHFALVVFSFNGLDSIGRDDRLHALGELQRVTRPGGRLVISALNKNGPSYRIRPWQIVARRNESHAAAKAVLSLPLHLGHDIAATRNWRRLRRHAVDVDGWAISPIPGLGFDMLVHFTTRAQMVADAAAAGLDTDVVFAHDGSIVADQDEDSGVHWFQFVLLVRKSEP
jgi:SAM-dependent methyltransferase